MRVLITGGAGFIGSHLADLLLSQGHEVVVFDNLDEQVHPERRWPSYQRERPGLTRIRGDIRDPQAVNRALRDGVETVIHLAAKVGVGQGQYQIADYYDVNVGGTAILLEEMARLGTVERLFVAGSMSAYGEGAYRHRHFEVPCDRSAGSNERTEAQLQAGEWEPRPMGKDWYLDPVGVTEEDPLRGRGFYAMTKAETERMALAFGRTYNVPVWVGRFFNCYGTRQALGNPYTGVVAIFANQILAGERPTVYEDGKQTRDFINVADLVCAVAWLVSLPHEKQGVYNIGTGTRTSVAQIAELVAKTLGSDLGPDITFRYRSGDIRHCFADISKIRATGWEPQVSLNDGMELLFDWLRTQRGRPGLQKGAEVAMKTRGLIR